LNTAVISATSGAVCGLIGVLIGQCLTQRRHTEALRQTAELEEQRANQAALLKYFELGGQLIRVPADADYLGPILRAQTLTLLEVLEPGHKRILLQFLYESGLLGPEKPGFSLRGANLVEANLLEANLKEADLSGAFLQEMTKEGLTQTQIDEAVGNDATKLPDHLQRPRTGGSLGGRVRRKLK
jgi:hypothetical protein